MLTWTRLTLLFVAGFLSFNVASQNFDAGIFFGISHYQGDLQRSYVEILEAHHANGIFIRYNFSNKIALKLNYYQGVLSGSDANYPGSSVRDRNLSFRTPVHEIGLTAEYTFIQLGVLKRHWKKNQVRYKASGYVFSGFSTFYFNPKAYYNGNWHELQPLGTEGQGRTGYGPKYNRVSFSIPYGVGFKFNLTSWAYVGCEVGYRKTFTDYLDDVSGNYPDLQGLMQEDPLAAALSYRSPEINDIALENYPSGTTRGSAKWKDSFVFLGVTAAVRLMK